MLKGSETDDPTHLLIVDDDLELLELLSQLLSDEGFVVSTAPDGETGLAKLESDAFQLVVLDVGLPGLDGLDVLCSIRAKSSVPVVMLTASGDLEFRIRGLAAGADDYLPKPFSSEELLLRLRAVLRRTEAAPPADAPPVSSRLAEGPGHSSRGCPRPQRANRRRREGALGDFSPGPRDCPVPRPTARHLRRLRAGEKFRQARHHLPVEDVSSLGVEYAKVDVFLAIELWGHLAGNDEKLVGVPRLGRGSLQITVADDGPGVSEEFVERMSDPFVRGADRSASSGAGGGLALVKRAIEAHGGSVEASTPSSRSGLVMRMTLPSG